MGGYSSGRYRTRNRGTVDAALRLDPERIFEQFGAQHMDLGQTWWDATGLPFVFATWSGPRPSQWPWLAEALRASLDYGFANLDAMIAQESARLGFEPGLVRDYFTRQSCSEYSA